MAELIILPTAILSIYVLPRIILKVKRILVKYQLKKNLMKRTFISDSNDICIICQEDYCVVKKCTELYCGHKYHKKCIDKWVYIKPTCPLCNEGILMRNRKRSHV